MLGPSSQSVLGTNSSTSPAHHTETNQSIIDLGITKNAEYLLPYKNCSNIEDMSKLESLNNNYTFSVFPENIDVKNVSTLPQIMGDKPETEGSTEVNSMKLFLQRNF